MEEKDIEDKNQAIFEIKNELETTNKKHPVNIQQLIVAPLPRRKTYLGEVKDIIDVTQRKIDKIDAIIWNEKNIQLVINDGTTEITFTPEFHPCTNIFFDKEDKRRSNWDSEDAGKRIWEGEYQPVQFSKSNLIKYLKEYAKYFEPEVEQAIKEMTVTEKKTEQSEMLSLEDDDNVRTVTKEIKNTNIPRNFKAMMPLFGGFSIELDFEACVKKKTDDYGRSSKQNIIELRVKNAREAIRQVMEEILTKFPEKIPKYYGKTEIFSSK